MVECASLERMYASNRIGGSNPLLSAQDFIILILKKFLSQNAGNQFALFVGSSRRPMSSFFPS